jgi:hypothetical protein
MRLDRRSPPGPRRPRRSTVWHFQYQGVPGNSNAVGRFRHEALRRWKWALGPRSQRYFNWERFEAMLRRHPLPPARLPPGHQRQLRLANM